MLTVLYSKGIECLDVAGRIRFRGNVRKILGVQGRHMSLVEYILKAFSKENSRKKCYQKFVFPRRLRESFSRRASYHVCNILEKIPKGKIVWTKNPLKKHRLSRDIQGRFRGVIVEYIFEKFSMEKQ